MEIIISVADETAIILLLLINLIRKEKKTQKQ